MNAEPTITCPKCQTEIKLTESLAAPIVQSAREAYEKQLAQKDDEIATREKAIKEREDAVASEKAAVDQQVQDKVKAERTKIAIEETKKARLALATDLDQKTQELTDLKEVLKVRDEKLAEAQKAQAEMIRKQRELDDAKRELELTVEKRVQESLGKTRDQARKEAEEQLGLKVAEKEQTIAAMQKQIGELKRKAEQGSQQLQGEVLELELESLLEGKFPHDCIEPVPKGDHGGDILHRVILPAGTMCGTILWESKRTKNWSDGWLPKLRDDQRAAKAEVGIIVSTVLPQGVDTFDQLDGVWITHPRAALPLALSLRQMLIEVAAARQASDGQQTKMELIYQYLTGPKFRLRVQGIVEAFSNMGEDLQKEKKAITKQWAKREEQITRVLEATVGMYGELQGIAGASLKEIEGLSIETLALPSEATSGK